jgi:phenylalanyl-tRNA synthetase beta chain
MEAQAVASRLMIELCGARALEGTIDFGGPGPAPSAIRLRERRVSALLGAPISRARCREILEALEFDTDDAPDGLDVRPPPFRRDDVTREADLIEEVARLDGLDKLPVTLPSRHGAAGRLTPRQTLRRRAADALAAQGVDEIVGWSFAGPSLDERLRLPAGRPAVELQNPMSVEQSRLRTTLLGSLLDAAERNRARGAATIRLFEAGAVYLPVEGRALPAEPYHIGALLSGPVRPATWREQDPPRADFFAAKGVLGGLLGALRVSWAVEPAGQPFLHPGRAAMIVVGGEPAGWLGELHPAVAGDTAAFELDLDAVGEPGSAVYEDLISFPAVREDLAVVVREGTSAAAVVAAVREAGAPLLSSAEVFDVYRDLERIGAGSVSLALRLTYRVAERTLTDEEVAAKRAEIAAALRVRLGGSVRAP